MNAPLRPLALVAALGAALAVAAPQAAPAQGILKRMKDKAAGAVADKAVDKAADKAGASNAAGSTRTPKFNDEVLEITSERIAQVTKGLDAEAATYKKIVSDAAAGDAAYAAKQRQYQADVKTYEQKKKAYDAETERLNAAMTKWQQCLQGTKGYQQSQADAMATAQKAGAMSEAERQEMVRKLQAMEQRMKDAERRGDHAKMQLLADSVRLMMGMSKTDVQTQAAQGREMQQCGQPPKEMMDPAAMQQRAANEPKPPVEPEKPASLQSDAIMPALDNAGAKAAGLPVRAYAVMRERILAYCSYGDEVISKSSYVYAPGELEALRGGKDKCEQYRAALRGDQIDWQAWGGRSD